MTSMTGKMANINSKNKAGPASLSAEPRRLPPRDRRACRLLVVQKLDLDSQLLGARALTIFDLPDHPKSISMTQLYDSTQRLYGYICKREICIIIITELDHKLCKGIQAWVLQSAGLLFCPGGCIGLPNYAGLR